MFFIEHIYFLSALFFFVFWILLFLTNKKNRKQMIYVSLVTMILGLLVQEMHLLDWWQPNFLFDSFIKIEDVFFGFSAGGIASAAYNIFKSYLREKSFILFSFNTKLVTIVAILFSLFGLFYLFDLHSFWSSIIAFSVPVFIISVHKKRFLIPMSLTGIFMVIFALAGYLFAIHIKPTFIQEEYLLEQLSGILLLGIPIEELLWFFFAGLGVSAFQEILWPR